MAAERNVRVPAKEESAAVPVAEHAHNDENQENASAFKQSEVGEILLSAYREALNEAVPTDMLDLLSKLR